MPLLCLQATELDAKYNLNSKLSTLAMATGGIPAVASSFANKKMTAKKADASATAADATAASADSSVTAVQPEAETAVQPEAESKGWFGRTMNMLDAKASELDAKYNLNSRLTRLNVGFGGISGAAMGYALHRQQMAAASAGTAPDAPAAADVEQMPGVRESDGGTSLRTVDTNMAVDPDSAGLEHRQEGSTAI